MRKYSGVVVLYNPEDDVYKNIYSYIDDIDKLYIIDNSADNHDEILNKYEFYNKCKYVPLKKNYGLAYALNQGCRMALEDGYDYVLTMDQDSEFEHDAVKIMKNFIEHEEKEYAIVCPNVHSIYFDRKEQREKTAYIRWRKDERLLQNWAMTSGSMMSIRAYSKVGGFDDKMFIAHVDIDLGIKLMQNGEQIIMLGNALICQRFGHSEPRKILWKTVHPSFASPVRTYYLFRNQKYLEQKYGKAIKEFIDVSLVKFVIKITLFENEKISKYKMMLRAFKDAKTGRMGEYREQ